MKLITVKVNETIDHIINFDSKHQSAKSYIFECKQDPQYKILSFTTNNKNPNEVLVQEEKSKYVGIKEFHYTKPTEDDVADDGVNKYSIRIELVEKYSKPSKIPPGLVYRNGILYLKDLALTEAHEISVEFEYGAYKSDLIIYYVPKENMYQAVIDFGSESSQVILTKGKNVNKHDVMDLFTEMKSGLDKRSGGSSFSEKEDKEFMQYDSDSNKFYRSVFLAKRLGFNRDELKPHLPLEDNEVCKILTFRKDRENYLKSQNGTPAPYMILPNAKLTSFGGVDLPSVDGERVHEFNDRYFYRSAINSFVSLVMDKVNSFRVCTSTPAPRFISFKILMPNVYPQQTVSRNLNDLFEDITRMLQPDNKYENIRGFDLMSISESDASFIGYVNLHENNMKMDDGYYLIVDAGKGTIDFSIIKYSMNEGLYESIFRSGIIGAGNTITYAFLLSFLKEALRVKYKAEENESEEEAIRSYIYNNILNGDLAYQHRLVSLVEQYKKNYQDNKLKGQSKSTVDITDKKMLSKEPLDKLEEWMRTVDYKIDISYVNGAIEDIVNKLIRKFPRKLPVDAKFDLKKVLFTGRSFLFSPLKKAVRKALLDKYKGLEEMNCQEVEDLNLPTVMKMVCLFPFLSGNYNGRLVGVPFVCDNTETTKNETSPKQDAKKWFPFTAIFPNGKKIKESLQNLESHFEITGRSTRYAELTPKEKNTNLSPMVYGFNADFEPLTTLNVGSTEYKYVTNMKKKVKVDIFFDGYEFIVRAGSTFLPSPTTFGIDGGHVFASQFPYGSVSRVNDIYIPTPVEAKSDEDDKSGTDLSENTSDAADLIPNAEIISQVANFTKRK